MKAISAAFVKAQQSFDEAIKNSKNPFFKSDYAGLSECIDAVFPHLHANGIAVIQLTHDCADGVIVETLFIHESGEQLSGGKLHVPAGKNDPQAYGSALTYARRYSLSAACSIKTADDDGNEARTPNPPPTPTPEPKKETPPQSTSGDKKYISEAQYGRLKAICKSADTPLAEVSKKFGFSKAGEILRADYDKICEWAEVGYKSEMVQEVFYNDDIPF
jgi:hypothetical protein